MEFIKIRKFVCTVKFVLYSTKSKKKKNKARTAKSAKLQLGKGESRKQTWQLLYVFVHSLSTFDHGV